jgi:hypothetical protein
MIGSVSCLCYKTDYNRIQICNVMTGVMVTVGLPHPCQKICWQCQSLPNWTPLTLMVGPCKAQILNTPFRAISLFQLAHYEVENIDISKVKYLVLLGDEQNFIKENVIFYREKHNETNLFPFKFTREMLRADELKVLAPKEKMMEVSKRWKDMSKDVKDR